MKEFYRVLSIFLVISLIMASIPPDLFALRPASHKLSVSDNTHAQGYKPVKKAIPQNYTIQAMLEKGMRQFIAKDLLSTRLEFSLLDTDTIKDFLENNNIIMYNPNSLSIVRLSLLIYLLKKLPKEHIQGIRIVFADNLVTRNLPVSYLKFTDTITIYNKISLIDLPVAFIHAIGKRVAHSVSRETKNAIYNSRWELLPFLGAGIILSAAAVIVAYTILPLFASFATLPQLIAYLSYAMMIKWSADLIFKGGHLKKFAKKTGIFFGVLNLYIDKAPSLDSNIKILGVTPTKYFTDAYSAFVLLNQEFKEATDNRADLRKAYDVLETRVFKNPRASYPGQDKLNPDNSGTDLLDNFTLTTKGDVNGNRSFTLSFSAYDRQNSHTFLKAKEQPDVVFLAFDPLVNSSVLEGLFFQRMFFDPIIKGYSARYAALLNDLKALEKDYSSYQRKVDEIDTFKYEVMDAGYDVDVLVKGLISGRITVVVDSEIKKKKTLRLLKSFFIGHDAGFYEAKLIDSGYSVDIAKMLSKEFARNRSFHFPGGLFNREGNISFKDDEAVEKLINEIIDIRVLALGDSIALSKGLPSSETPANTLRIEKTEDSLIVTEGEGAHAYYIDRACLASRGENQFYSSWTPRQVNMVEEAFKLSEKDRDELVIMPFGNADPTPFSGKQDYTNLLMAINGKGILVDPSAQTLRNIRANELLDNVDAFYLSHVHWDHFGGMADFAYQQLLKKANGGQLGSMPLIAAIPVYETAFEYLNTLTGISRYDFEKIFPLVKTEKDADREVVLFNDTLSLFAGMEMLLNRTFGHPLPTYGFRISTEKGIFAYLPDSLMPSKESPLRQKFIEFYENGVDLLISENGVPGVHIEPEELIDAFKELANIGAVHTVHSAGQQNEPGLQRAQVFESLRVIKRADRRKSIVRADNLLKESTVIETTAENIIFGDLIRKQFATIGSIEEMRGGHIIYREGDLTIDNPYVYIILSGKVNIEGIADMPNGIKTLGKGHVLGEMAILRRALSLYTEDDLKALFRKDMISQQFIAGAGYYIWNVMDISEIKSLDMDKDMRDRFMSLFNDSKQLPRSKTVVASQKSVLLRMHTDEFIKLLDAELKETGGVSSLARSLQVIMKRRLDQDNRINGYLAPIRPGTATAVLPVTEKTSSSGNKTPENSTRELERIFNDVNISTEDHLFQMRLLTYYLINNKALVEKIVKRYIKDKNITVSMCATCGRIYAVRKYEGPSGISHGKCIKDAGNIIERYDYSKQDGPARLKRIRAQEAREAKVGERVAEYLKMHPVISERLITHSRNLSVSYIRKAIQSAA